MIRWLCCWVLLLANPVLAWQVDEADVKARLVISQERAYLSEEVSVSLELATPQWFTRAAHISLPTQADAMWLQRQVFADNSRERIDGSMWTVQRWPLSVYPRSSGKLLLMPLVVEVGVADSEGRSVLKRFSLGGFHVLGVPLPDVELVASQYQISVDHSGVEPNAEGDIELAAGDSLQITYTSQAEHTLAMFLPQISPSLSADAGVAVYAELPTLRDENERGRRNARREDRYTLLAQRPLSLYLPGLQVAWLDKNTQQRRTAELPAVGINPASHNVVVRDSDRPWLVWLVLVLMLAALYIVASDAQRAMTPLHRLRATHRDACLAAAKQGDWALLAQHIYALHDSYADYRQQSIRVTIEQLCDESAQRRLTCLLDAAYSGASALVDVDDHHLLRHFFKRLARPVSRPLETHDSFYIR